MFDGVATSNVAPNGALRVPFPYFGGKSRAAHLVWERFGNLKNYVEPFFGSGAVLLARPHAPQVETINDKDHFLVNFWRAVQADPDAVARHADWPVSECDLASRHYWLVTEGAARIERCDGDPAHYDAQVAGWWLWGACAWIGVGWCHGNGPWQWTGDQWVKRSGAGKGINRQLPRLSGAGQGINRVTDAPRADFIRDWMQRLHARLRDVRIACGDWSRVCGDSVTSKNGLTGIFLDPPYSVPDRVSVYRTEDFAIANDVRAWAIEAGKNPKLRIAVAGYADEHAFSAGWTAVSWKANGGYGSQGNGQGRENASRETIWFSPHCITPDALTQDDLLKGN